MAEFLPALRKGFRPPSRRSVPVSEAKALLTDYYGGVHATVGRAQGWGVQRSVAEGFERIVWVFKPVNAISGNQAKLPYVLKQREAVVEDHPMLRILNKKANKLETGKALRKRLSAQILLSKPGAFVELTFSRGRTPLEAHLLPPGRTRIVPGTGTDLVSHYEMTDSRGYTRTIEPENVRWFRDPHPLDPYSGVTPLEAAGMSIELDYFARLFNTTFLRNDGRPGGIVGVDGDISDEAAERIERKFGKGPMEAGKITVLNGGLSWVDPSASPRDLQYQALSRITKNEILVAFGTPESVLGYAADRTFANAEQELYNFWTVTMPDHLDIILSGFDEDSEDELEGAFDTSKIEVLQIAEDKRLARMREEVAAGLRSIYSYAQETGQDYIEDTIHTRSLLIASGKTPLPINEEDAEEMGLGPSAGEDAPGDVGFGQVPGAPVPPQGVDPAAGNAPAVDGANPPEKEGVGGIPDATGTGGAGARALAAARQATQATPATKTLYDRMVDQRQGKAHARPRSRARLTVVGGKARRAAERSDEADESARDQLEADLSRVLGSLAEKWIERTAVKVGGPKSRKGTRHWVPEHPGDGRVGTKALDPYQSVDEQQWAEEAEQASHPYIVAAAVAAALATYMALRTDEEDDESLPVALLGKVTAMAGEVAHWIGQTAAGMAAEMVRVINDEDQLGAPLTTVVQRVRGQGSRLLSWAKGVALQAATATSEGARQESAEHIGQTSDVFGTWISRRDDRVRPSHVIADGQKRPVGALYEVGAALLRYPGDPLGPAGEVRNCRCHLIYRSRRTGRFVPIPNLGVAQ